MASRASQVARKAHLMAVMVDLHGFRRAVPIFVAVDLEPNIIEANYCHDPNEADSYRRARTECCAGRVGNWRRLRHRFRLINRCTQRRCNRKRKNTLPQDHDCPPKTDFLLLTIMNQGKNGNLGKTGRFNPFHCGMRHFCNPPQLKGAHYRYWRCFTCNTAPLLATLHLAAPAARGRI